MPAGHSTSTAPVTLQDLFRMPETPTDVVIRVGDDPVTRAEFEQRLRVLQIQLTAAGVPRDLQRRKVLQSAVEQIVEERLMARIADQMGVTVDPRAVRAWVGELEKRMNADKAFAAFLERAGNTAEQRQKDGHYAVLVDGIHNKLSEELKTKTATTVTAYYERRKTDFTERAGRETWRIFIRAPSTMVQRDLDIAKSKAERIQAEAAKSPEAFERLARQHSEGGKGHDGGYIGFVSKGTFAPALEQTLMAAKNGVLPLHQDASGFFIYKVGRIRKEHVKPFAEVKELIFKKLFRKLVRQEIDRQIAQLKSKFKVEVNIPELG